LFLIANDLSKMQIDALVSEADIGNASVGQNVDFKVDAFPYRTFHGKLSQIRYGAITNQNVINYDCVVAVNNSDLKLLPGMTANVSIITAEHNDALKIPNAALRFRPPEESGGAGTNAAPQFASRGQNGGAEAGGRGGGGRQRGGEGGMGGGGSQRGAGPGSDGVKAHPRADRQLVRTVYVLASEPDGKNGIRQILKPAQIKTGITDGISTEVLEGLDEGAKVVVGVISNGEGESRPSANPFGRGPFRRF
jgi:HlyD family secretion protein